MADDDSSLGHRCRRGAVPLDLEPQCSALRQFQRMAKRLWSQRMAKCRRMMIARRSMMMEAMLTKQQHEPIIQHECINIGLPRPALWVCKLRG